MDLVFTQPIKFMGKTYSRVELRITANRFSIPDILIKIIATLFVHISMNNL